MGWGVAGSASLCPWGPRAWRGPGTWPVQHPRPNPGLTWLGEGGGFPAGPVRAALGHAARLWVGEEMQQKGLLDLAQVTSGWLGVRGAGQFRI